MKKYLFYLMSTLLFSACMETEMPPQAQSSDLHSHVNWRSASEAIEIANAFAEEIDMSSRVRARQATSSTQIEYLGNIVSRAYTDTTIYVVNYDNDEGYAIIARNPAATPVLAAIDNGRFEANKVLDNPGFLAFLEQASSYAINPSELDSLPERPFPQPIPYSISSHVEPVLEVEWGQEYPEGIYCINGLSGCSQTAMAQMLSYLETPASITFTYPERDKPVQLLDWAELKKHKRSCSSKPQFLIEWHLQECTASEESHKTIGRLHRELGYRNNAEYIEGFTSTTIYSSNTTMKELLPNYNVSDVSGMSASTLYSYLKDNAAIAYVRGGGHAWVCDGGHYYQRYNGGILIGGEKEKPKYYFHYNWGWCGYQNGYFFAGVYNPDNNTPEDQLPRGDMPFSRTYSSNVMYYVVYK